MKPITTNMVTKLAVDAKAILITKTDHKLLLIVLWNSLFSLWKGSGKYFASLTVCCYMWYTLAHLLEKVIKRFAKVGIKNMEFLL